MVTGLRAGKSREEGMGEAAEGKTRLTGSGMGSVTLAVLQRQQQVLSPDMLKEWVKSHSSPDTKYRDY